MIILSDIHGTLVRNLQVDEVYASALIERYNSGDEVRFFSTIPADAIAVMGWQDQIETAARKLGLSIDPEAFLIIHAKDNVSEVLNGRTPDIVIDDKDVDWVGGDFEHIRPGSPRFNAFLEDSLPHEGAEPPTDSLDMHPA